MAVHRLSLGFVAATLLTLVVAAATPERAATASSRSSTSALVMTVTPVRPYRPGDKIWLTTPAPPAVVALSDGCQRVPATGYIGTNVYANSTAQYANYWSWSEASSAQAFYWYIKKTDNTTVAFDFSSGGGGSRSVAANVYYWKVQNQGATPQAWNVCYSG